MLELGVFEGKYLNDCINEFPSDWFHNAKTSNVANPKLNYFGHKARLSLSEWRKNNWITKDDPRGWFQWYCRLYYGRRHADDDLQVKRWISFISRHYAQIKNSCDIHDINCRPIQRQALLQWAFLVN